MRGNWAAAAAAAVNWRSMMWRGQGPTAAAMIGAVMRGRRPCRAAAPTVQAGLTRRHPTMIWAVIGAGGGPASMIGAVMRAVAVIGAEAAVIGTLSVEVRRGGMGMMIVRSWRPFSQAGRGVGVGQRGADSGLAAGLLRRYGRPPVGLKIQLTI